jgi:membrane protease subunit HflK
MSEEKNTGSAVSSSLNRLVRFFLRWVLLVLLILYLVTGFFSIKQNELGVLVRLGKTIDGNVHPGMHYALPWPVDEVYKVPVKQVRTIVLDDFSNNLSPDSPAGPFKESTNLSTYAITGDNNIVSITLLLKFNIISPVKYLFNTTGAEDLLRSAACNTLIYSLASMPVDRILTYGKKEIEDSVRLHLQEKLSRLGSGLAVSFVEIKEIGPPPKVQAYFDDVINAKVEKNKMVNEAISRSNNKISSARGNAAKTVQGARGEKKEKISHAEGEASRFLSQLEEYSKSKKETRRKLYLDFINSAYPFLKEIIVVDNKKGKKLTSIKIFPR